MKRTGYCIAALCILFSLAGCSRKQPEDTDLSLKEMAAAITASQPELPPLKQTASGEEDFTRWLSDYYFIESEQVEDGVIYYADGVEASEIAVLLLSDEADREGIEEALKEYIQNRAAVFEGYAPRQAALAKEGAVAVNGRYTALLICGKPSAAKEAFFQCFGEKKERGETTAGGAAASSSAPETEEKEPDNMSEEACDAEAYDAEAVLQAWRSGDDTSLSERNRSILNKAREVINEEISDSMSDYEKELAIHDWITGWSSFDYSVFGHSSGDGFEEGSDTPYGVLIQRSAMCHGYSSTFQLFMDMLDIECLTVFGIPGSNGVEHSWNMVKLEGDWYCVDVAWDDPIGGSPGHTYFNVTSEDLRSGSIHRWDESSVPEAAGREYAYGRH